MELAPAARSQPVAGGRDLGLALGCLSVVCGVARLVVVGVVLVWARRGVVVCVLRVACGCLCCAVLVVVGCVYVSSAAVSVWPAGSSSVTRFSVWPSADSHNSFNRI